MQGISPASVYDIKANRMLTEDDFEVSMFLTETSTRHSLLTKRKHFREKGPSLMQSNASKLISETNDQPMDVDESDFAPIRIEDDSGDEEGLDLSSIPAADHQLNSKRERGRTSYTAGLDPNVQEAAIDIESDGEEPPSKRRRELIPAASDSDGEEDKKKMAMDVSYEGFAIYGRVLCLVVKRRDAGGGKPTQSSASQTGVATGQAKMENWISSTQMPADEV